MQIAIPAGGEERARAFYRDVLGLIEEEKPASLKAGGGCWFVGGSAHLHVGIDAGFVPARKAHPALLVNDLKGLAARLAAAGHDAVPDHRLPGYRRIFTADPFGNRIELMEVAA